MIVNRRCPICLKPSSVSVPEYALAAWRQGAMIQDAMPMLTAEEREIIKTGIHDSCWNGIFLKEQEDIEDEWWDDE